MDPDRRRRASEVMRGVAMGDEWMDAIDPDAPAWLREHYGGVIEAYRTGDVEAFLETAHPDVVIVQPPELPDARTYRGHEGMIETLLDWPLEWEGFAVEPRRVFAPDDTHVLVDTVHTGRSRAMGIEIEAGIVWLLAFEDSKIRRWDMFTCVDDALAAVGAPSQD